MGASIASSKTMMDKLYEPMTLDIAEINLNIEKRRITRQLSTTSFLLKLQVNTIR
jgi:hypothetical protein